MTKVGLNGKYSSLALGVEPREEAFIASFDTDERGETLRLECFDCEVWVPFERIEEMIRLERSK